MGIQTSKDIEENHANIGNASCKLTDETDTTKPAALSFPNTDFRPKNAAWLEDFSDKIIV